MRRIAALLTAAVVVLLGPAPAAQAAPNWQPPPDLSTVASASGNDRVGYALRLIDGDLVYVAAPRAQYKTCGVSNSPQWCINTWARFYTALDQFIAGPQHNVPCVRGATSGGSKWVGLQRCA